MAFSRASRMPTPREQEVKARFEAIWAAAGQKTGASAGKVLYGGRGLQTLITNLRKSESPNAQPATANDALFLVKQWGVPDGELEHYAVEKDKVRGRAARDARFREAHTAAAAARGSAPSHCDSD